MKISISSLGKFHAIDLAKEMARRGHETHLYSGYPRPKLAHATQSGINLHSFPYIHAPYMFLAGLRAISRTVLQPVEYIDRLALDTYVSRHITVCDIFHGLSSSSLRSGKQAQKMGAAYVCDRGSSHIEKQERLLKDEFKKWGLLLDGIDKVPFDPRIVATEVEEYETSDLIFVPSKFALRSFLDFGVDREKIRLAPYGADIESFHPDGSPPDDSFDILFVGAMSLRKGVPYLVEAFKKFKHPRKRLKFAGHPSDKIINLLKSHSLWDNSIEILGHRPQETLRILMSRSHALVLPSIEDGFGLVIPQAMACGCPVIASENTGGSDWIQNGHNGFIIPAADSDAILSCFERLADCPALRATLAHNALSSIQSKNGWKYYGDVVEMAYREVMK